jgi:ABC-2 type transport system ATP-binding protein
LISSHILPEVEMTCSRVMIMLNGKILASDTPDNLQKLMAGTGQIIAEIAAPVADLQVEFAQMAEVEHFDVSAAEGDFQRCSLHARDGMDLRPQIFALVQERGWQLRELTRNRHSLEDIYVRVTRPNEEEEEI